MSPRDGGETLGEPFSTPCYSGFAKVRVFDDISGDVDVGKPMQTQVRVALDEILVVKCRAIAGSVFASLKKSVLGL